MIGLLRALAIAKELAEIVIPILGWWGKTKAQKKLIKTEEVLSAVITGVEKYDGRATTIKETIKTVASAIPDVENRLNAYVHRFLNN